MNSLIISPHTDDAIFSLGDFIPQLGEVTILAPFAGIPNDMAGRKKHLRLREEHASACALLGVNYINGDFLDDVYPPADYKDVVRWLSGIVLGYDNILVPLGIFHKDHVLLREIFINEFRVDGFYTELPYRNAFPALALELISKFTKGRERMICYTGLKRPAVEKYVSQNGGPVMDQVMVTEEIYK